MIVYRLSKQAFVNDLSGYGAERTGGRWNSKGTPLVYTASSRALAVVEIAVHVPLGIVPTDYYITEITIPDNQIFKFDIAKLSENWNSNPFVKATQIIGDQFIRDNQHLILEVPSAAVAGDHNYLLNPRHIDFRKIKIKRSEAFLFDSRLFKK